MFFDRRDSFIAPNIFIALVSGQSNTDADIYFYDGVVLCTLPQASAGCFHEGRLMRDKANGTVFNLYPFVFTFHEPKTMPSASKHLSSFALL